MFIKVEVENFRSIRSKQTFHMISRPFKRFQNHIFNYQNKFGILKTTGIYGHNGSGKSNLFKSVYLIKQLVLERDYLTRNKSKNVFSPFLFHPELKHQPVKISLDYECENVIYRYEIKIQHDRKKILEETLTKISPEEKLIFSKKIFNNELEIEFPNWEDPQDTILSYCEKYPNASLFSFDFINSKEFVTAKSWFVDELRFSFPEKNEFNIVYTLHKNPKYLELANKLINNSNLGIEKIEIVDAEFDLTDSKISSIQEHLESNDFWSEKNSDLDFITAIKNGDSFILKKIKFIHPSINNQSNELFFKHESKGTQSLVENIIPAVLLSLNEGKTYFIDEIDRSLHPIFLKKILFQLYKIITQESDGQIIFTTHEDYIMDEGMMRQDEIWFAEKNDSLESEYFPLSDFENVRFDLNLKKNYLKGKFGGVPEISESELLQHSKNV